MGGKKERSKKMWKEREVRKGGNKKREKEEKVERKREGRKGGRREGRAGGWKIPL